MQRSPRQATYDDIINAPENMVAEIVDGELYTSPRPASPHAVAGSVIGGDLLGSFHWPPGGPKGPGGWWILYESELHFARNVLVPDLAGWRRERMPAVPNTPAFTLAPDWVCEVVSPHTARLDRVRKMPVYATEGVAYLWLVDPLMKTLEVYRLENQRWVVASTHAGSDPCRAEPFEAVELDMTRWWIE